MEKKSASSASLSATREGGGLHHDADLDVGIVLEALGLELGLALLDESLDGADLLDAGNEGDHDLDITEGTGASRARSWTLY